MPRGPGNRRNQPAGNRNFNDFYNLPGNNTNIQSIWWVGLFPIPTPNYGYKLNKNILNLLAKYKKNFKFSSSPTSPSYIVSSYNLINNILSGTPRPVKNKLSLQLRKNLSMPNHNNYKRELIRLLRRPSTTHRLSNNLRKNIDLPPRGYEDPISLEEFNNKYLFTKRRKASNSTNLSKSPSKNPNLPRHKETLTHYNVRGLNELVRRGGTAFPLTREPITPTNKEKIKERILMVS